MSIDAMKKVLDRNPHKDVPMRMQQPGNIKTQLWISKENIINVNDWAAFIKHTRNNILKVCILNNLTDLAIRILLLHDYLLQCVPEQLGTGQ